MNRVTGLLLVGSASRAPVSLSTRVFSSVFHFALLAFFHSPIQGASMTNSIAQLVGHTSAIKTRSREARPSRQIGILTSIAGLSLAASAWAQPNFVPPAPEPAARPAPVKIEDKAPAQPQAPGVELMPAAPQAPLADPAYKITRLDLSYFAGDTASLPEGLPDINAVRESVVVPLSELPDGSLIPQRPGLPAVNLRLSQIDPVQGVVLRYSGLQAVSVAVTQEMMKRDVFGIYVGPTSDEIENETNADKRGGNTALTLFIVYGTVNNIRTVASGDRLAEGDRRVNNEKHDRIRDRSPIKGGGVLQRAAVDDYVFRLNRHPGRRVDVAVAPAADVAGQVDLDYLVTEAKPWSIYAQTSNTGTASTEKWRQRFGFTHNQLTGNDDILKLDYLTAAFKDTHAFVASYERPVAEKVSVKAFGSWNQFEASDVGVTRQNFEGDGWSLGAEVIWKAFQKRELFVDLFAGARWENTTIDNNTAGINGEDDFFILSAGARLERVTEVSSTFAQLSLETNISSIADTSKQDSEQLGRFNPDEDWFMLRYSAEHAMFLEPLLFPSRFRGEGLPEGKFWQPGMTRANEIAFNVRGQFAFDARLVPTQQAPVGGFFSVRGYPESITAGDNTIIGTAEYRLYVTRLFAPDPGQQGFRWKPMEPYGTGDWDFILRGFVDAAKITSNNKLPFEFDETLVGAGIGAEVQVQRWLNLRLDWGFALNELDDPAAESVDSGDNRVHFIATVLF
jgi:hemolysin activation/secretion protein